MKKLMFLSVVAGILLVGGYYFWHINNVHAKDQLLLHLTSKDPLQFADFQMGGIKLGQQVSDVIRIYGKPTKKYKDKMGETFFSEYPGFKIKYGNVSGILLISVYGGRMKTPRGISIGDKEETVIYRYGKTEKLEDNSLYYQKYESINDHDFTFAMEFQIKNRVVNKIMIYYAAD